MHITKKSVWSSPDTVKVINNDAGEDTWHQDLPAELIDSLEISAK